MTKQERERGNLTETEFGTVNVNNEICTNALREAQAAFLVVKDIWRPLEDRKEAAEAMAEFAEIGKIAAETALEAAKGAEGEYSTTVKDTVAYMASRATRIVLYASMAAKIVARLQ